MTEPDLESARVKLNRAREHAQMLQAEQKVYFKGERQPFSSRLELDPDHGDRILGIVDTVEDPPAFFSAILGDAISNLRSALDHIAWQLFKHGRTPDLKPGQERRVQFPICDTVTEFDAEIGTRIPGIDTTVHESVVRRYQPYSRGRLAAGHPFAKLRELSNTDKHRNVHLTFWCASRAVFEISTHPAGCLIEGIHPLLDLNDPLKVETPLFYVVVADRSKCRGMYVQSRTSLSIAFDDGAWVHNTVSQIERMATDLLGEIEAVL